MFIITWLVTNYVEVLQALTLVVAALEAVTRLTPTKTDDGFVTRIGKVLDRVLDFAKVPNVVKKNQAPAPEVERDSKAS